MDELIQEMDSLFKQVVKYYPMNDIKETKKQWNDLVEAVAKQSKQQSNCNLPQVSKSVGICPWCDGKGGWADGDNNVDICKDCNGTGQIQREVSVC